MFFIEDDGCCVFLLPPRFTPGVAAQPEKKRTGPSHADVEAIKVSLIFILVLPMLTFEKQLPRCRVGITLNEEVSFDVFT